MRKTKKYPVVVTIIHPDGQRIEARIPLWKAYAIMADLEREKVTQSNDGIRTKTIPTHGG